LIGIMNRRMGEEEQATLRFRRYLAAAREGIRANPKGGGFYIDAALAYGRLGDIGKAEEMAERAFSLVPGNHFGHAQVLSVMGKKQEALQQLEIAVQKGWKNFIWMKVHIDLQNLHDEAGFLELLPQAIRP
jgi:tetratricopeptide (TPR) repeat protein